ncbi:MAG: hypothetical protein HXX08_09260 [Chloroflexi bacterium]|uniref:J domain-containing protein n=1 Tax=Candidatus Chlorohelix allophototropha TaxID=3003348 RepID=A0A8T7M075_9CHLR|nr:hypothetical protein [Chloroflexota bacterium]WJW67912.1 hypothetical protein OZ401_001196 [Chloroflexota bacterium L227-S17]
MDEQIFNHAIAIAKHGFKAEAHSILLKLAQANPNDINLLLWLAYTADDFATSKNYIESAVRLEPENPLISLAELWLTDAQKNELNRTAIPDEAKAIIQAQSAEAEELARKKVELAELESRLVQLEQDLATIEAELREFENLYLSIVGKKLAELDALTAQIAEIVARQQPFNPVATETAEQARAKAQESAQATEEAQERVEKQPKFQPSEDIKQLYRKAAKLIHPDLADNESEREKRTRLMAEVNRCYAEGNAAGLQQILEHWQDSAESVPGAVTKAELERILRKIAHVKNRIAEIETTLSQLKESEIYTLKLQSEAAKAEGIDLLQVMAEQLSVEIEQARIQLTQLQEAEDER